MPASWTSTLIGKSRASIQAGKTCALAPFSVYYRQRLDLLLHRVPFPQEDSEFQWFCEQVRNLGVRNYVEVGSRHGGSLLMVSRYVQPHARLVAVDLPNAEWGLSQSELRLKAVSEVLRTRGFEVTCILADSHDTNTLERVRRACGGVPVDLLFLDGDHTYEGVEQDWQMYSPLVRPGGLVAFHDLVTPPENPRVQVGKLFEELKSTHPSRQLIRKWGIGLIQK